MRTVIRVLSILVVTVSFAVVDASWAQTKSGGNSAMHAVLVTYENDTPADQLKNHPDNVAYAEALKKIPGLISKTWINDGKTLGGFHVFTDKASADAFINGEMFQNGVVKEPSNRNVQIRHFSVFSELTAMTGVSSKTLSGK